MHCRQCGAQIEHDSKFCENCGAPVEQQTTATGEPGTQTTNNEQTKQIVEQGKVISKNYLSFVQNALKFPYTVSKQVTEADKANGIITLVLFSLLLPLYSYTFADRMSADFIQIPFDQVVIKPFFILAIFFAVLIAVKLGVSKLMKVELSYFTILTKFGTLMVVPTTVLFAAVVFVILSIYNFSGILLGIAVGLTSVASAATLFSIKSHQPNDGLDVFYGIVITNVAMVIILLIIGDSMVGNLFNLLENGFYRLPF